MLEREPLYRVLGRGRILLERIEGQWHSARLLGMKAGELEPFEGLKPSQVMPILVFANEAEIEHFKATADPALETTRNYVGLAGTMSDQLLVGTLGQWVELVEPACKLKTGELAKNVEASGSLLEAAGTVFSQKVDLHSFSKLQQAKSFLESCTWRMNDLEDPNVVWSLLCKHAAYLRNLAMLQAAARGEAQGRLVRFERATFRSARMEPRFRKLIERSHIACVRTPVGELVRLKILGWRISTTNSPLSMDDLLDREVEIFPLEKLLEIRARRIERPAAQREMPADVLVAGRP